MAFNEGSGVTGAELARLPDDELQECIRARPLPRHVAIIMDGNGRWATRRGLPRVAGHSHGVGLGSGGMRQHHRARGSRLSLDVEQILGGKGEPCEPALRRRPADLPAGFVEQRAGENVAAGGGFGDSDGTLQLGACIAATCQQVQTGGVKVVHGLGAVVQRPDGG